MAASGRSNVLRKIIFSNHNNKMKKIESLAISAFVMTVFGIVLGLAGFLLRKAELAKPEAEREQWRVRLATALLFISAFFFFVSAYLSL